MDNWHILSRDELIAAYFDGELPPPWRAEAERLLATDPHCRQLFEDLQLISSSLKNLPSEELEPDFYRRVLQRAEWALLSQDAASGHAAPAPQPRSVHPIAQALAASPDRGSSGHTPADGPAVALPAVRRASRRMAARWQAPLAVSAAVALAAAALAFWPGAPHPEAPNTAHLARHPAAGNVEALASARRAGPRSDHDLEQPDADPGVPRLAMATSDRAPHDAAHDERDDEGAAHVGAAGYSSVAPRALTFRDEVALDSQPTVPTADIALQAPAASTSSGSAVLSATAVVAAPSSVAPAAGIAGRISGSSLKMVNLAAAPQPDDLAARTLAWKAALNRTAGELLVVCDVSHFSADALQQFELLLARQQVALVSDLPKDRDLAYGRPLESQPAAAAGNQRGQGAAGAGGALQRRSVEREHKSRSDDAAEDVHLYVVEASLEQISAVIAAVEAMDAGQVQLNVLEPGRRALAKADAGEPQAVLRTDSRSKAPVGSVFAAPSSLAEDASPAPLRGGENRAAGPDAAAAGLIAPSAPPAAASGSRAPASIAKGIAQPLPLPRSDALQAALAPQPAADDTPGTERSEQTVPTPPAHEKAPRATDSNERHVRQQQQGEPLEAPPPGAAAATQFGAGAAVPEAADAGQFHGADAQRDRLAPSAWRRAVFVLRLHSAERPPLEAPAPRQP